LKKKKKKKEVKFSVFPKGLVASKRSIRKEEKENGLTNPPDLRTKILDEIRVWDALSLHPPVTRPKTLKRTKKFLL